MDERRVAELLEPDVEPADMALVPVSTPPLERRPRARLGRVAVLPAGAYEPPEVHRMDPDGLSAAFPLSEPLGRCRRREALCVFAVELASARLS
jgi:hypothetical protein